jgi:ATP phosphoribosyltransferase regulatory subunit
MTFSEQKLRHYFEHFGYQSIEVPTLEPASLFLTKAGDQIIERLVTFEHQGNLSALRPEFTASAAYRYLSEQRTDVVRWQFSGPIFEMQNAEARTARPYQRHSIGAELIGFSGIFADAEIVALAVLGVEDQGLQHFKVKRADLYEDQITRDEVIAKLDRYLAVEKRDLASDEHDVTQPTMTTEMLSAVLSNSSRSQTLGGRTQHDIARRLLEKEQRAASRSQIIAALDFLIEWMAIRSPVEQALEQMNAYLQADDSTAHLLLKDWIQTLEYLEAYGVNRNQIELEPDLVRSWDYYNGMVFEVHIPDDISLAWGGRYDDLAQLLGAPKPVPAVGFVYDVEAVIEALGDSIDQTQGVVVTGSSSGVVQWGMALRNKGANVSVLPNSMTTAQKVIHITENHQAEYMGQRYFLNEVDRLIENLNLTQEHTGAR